MGWRVFYTNPYAGRRESTPVFASYQEAKESAEFLRFQGAKRVRILEVPHPPTFPPLQPPPPADEWVEQEGY